MKQYQKPMMVTLSSVRDDLIRTSGPEDSKALLQGFVPANQSLGEDTWKWN